MRTRKSCSAMTENPIMENVLFCCAIGSRTNIIWNDLFIFDISMVDQTKYDIIEMETFSLKRLMHSCFNYVRVYLNNEDISNMSSTCTRVSTPNL